MRARQYTALVGRLLHATHGEPSEASDEAICRALGHHLAGGLALVPWVAAFVVCLIGRNALSWSGVLRQLLLPLVEAACQARVRPGMQ